jgi:peptidoglycan/LPS O-acetylase OafA/YrhL
MHSAVPANERASQRIPLADALRALAIFLVVANHVSWHARPQIGHHGLTLGYLGVWGVNCFFVLTGFLLSQQYLRSILDLSPLPSTGAFYRRRFFRIYPLYFVAVVFSVFISWILNGELPSLLSVASHLVMLHGLSDKTVTDLNGPLWTMPIDALFYLLLPMVAYVLAKLTSGMGRRPRIVAVLAAAVGVMVLCLIFRWLSYSAHPLARVDFAASLVSVRNLFGLSASFALGLCVALASILGVRLGIRVRIGMIVLALVIALVQFVGRFGAREMLAALTLLDPLAGLSSACLLAALLLGGGRVIARVCSMPIVSGAAAIAYAVYLLHWPLLDLLQDRVLHGAVGAAAFVELWVLLGVSVVPLAFLAYRFIERPLLQVNSRSRKLTSAADGTPATVAGEALRSGVAR